MPSGSNPCSELPGVVRRFAAPQSPTIDHGRGLAPGTAGTDFPVNADLSSSEVTNDGGHLAGNAYGPDAPHDDKRPRQRPPPPDGDPFYQPPKGYEKARPG